MTAESPLTCSVALEFSLDSSGNRVRIPVGIERLVICGWTGRDRESVKRHVDELAELGVSPPNTVPCYYRGSAALVTTASSIQVLGTDSSGEVEALLVGTPSGIAVGVGSDHTDRHVEKYSIAVSKQLCAKPIASTVWLLDDVMSHWDELVVRSFATIGGKRVLYQEGQMAALLRPDDIVLRYPGSGNSFPEATLMFCGTVPAIGGIRPADRFEFELVDPVIGRRITHAYDVIALPVVS
jgi:hypothetical protein